jgi:hypothetical protein
MEKCIYCLNSYTLKGIKRHLLYCKSKVKQEKTDKVNKIINSALINYNSNGLFDNLPDELLFYISSYLQCKKNYKKNTYLTNFKYFTDIYQMRYTSKKLFYFLSPTKEMQIYITKICLEEQKETICKSYVMEKYNISDKEIMNIPHELCKNPYGGYYAMKIYKTVDILDYFYNKYGDEKGRNKYLRELEEEKLHKAQIKKEYLKKCNNILKKYNINKKNPLYNDYNYIYNISETIEEFENNINIYITINERKNLLLNMLNMLNINYYETTCVKMYIKKNKRTLNEAYDSIIRYYAITNKLNELSFNEENLTSNKYIQYIEYINNGLYSIDEIIQPIIEQNLRKKFIIDEFVKYNLYFNNSYLYNEDKEFEYELKYEENEKYIKYIYENNSIDNFIENIIHKIIRKRNLKSELNKYNLPLRSDSVLCDEYINENKRDINEVVIIMVEMDFYHKYAKYWKYYKSFRRIYESLKASELAKNKALEQWCLRHKTYDNVISLNYFPKSLYEKAYKIFNIDL